METREASMESFTGLPVSFAKMMEMVSESAMLTLPRQIPRISAAREKRLAAPI
jgi:hypothetical protein